MERPEVLLRDRDRLLEIRIIRNHDGGVARTPKRVEEKVAGEVHVGAPLFGPDHFNRLWTCRWRCGERHPDAVRQVATVADGYEGKRLKSAQVGLLPLGLVRIAGASVDPCGEAADRGYVVFGEEPVGQRLEIEPFVAGASKGAVVEAEALDADDRCHVPPPQGSRHGSPR